MSNPGTARLKVNPPVGEKPELEWIGVHAIRVDDSYQRALQAETSQSLIRRIAQFWDWGLCQPLVCSRRGDRHGVWVVDGQHRLAAAKMRGDLVDLPCVVQFFATASDEAAAFVALNQQRKALTAIDLFRAALAANDEAAIAISGLVLGAGLALAPHTNFTCWKPGMVSNIAGIQRCYRVHGHLVTDLSLRALAGGFKGKILRYAGSLFPGIFGCVAVEVKIEGGIDLGRLIDALARRSQDEWRQEIALEQAASGNDRKFAAKTVVSRAYRDQTKVAPRAAPRLAPTIALEAEVGPPPNWRWCDQCDRRVTGVEVERCHDQFCKAKALAA